MVALDQMLKVQIALKVFSNKFQLEVQQSLKDTQAFSDYKVLEVHFFSCFPKYEISPLFSSK